MTLRRELHRKRLSPPLRLLSASSSQESFFRTTRSKRSHLISLLLFLLLIFLSGANDARGSVHDKFATPFSPNLVTNPGFESDADGDGSPDGWESKFKEFYFFDINPSDRRGLRGGKSLFLKAGSIVTWKTKILGIFPGHHYLLTFWVRRDGWKDGEYPFIRIFGRTIRMNELFSWKGWRKVTYLLKAENTHETSLAFLGGKLSHGIAFDNVELRKLSIQLLSPARGEVFFPKKSTLSWKITPSELVLRLVIDLFSRSPSDNLKFGNGTKFELLSPQSSSIRLRGGLPAGKWSWRVRAYLGQEEVARSPIQFFKVPAGGENLTAQPAKRIRLYPEPPTPPFFPIGIFSAHWTETFMELKAAGFNSVQSYGPDPEKGKNTSKPLPATA